MITERTKNEIIQEKIKKAIEILEPIAKKYKRLSLAKEKLKEDGFWITDDIYRNTRGLGFFINRVHEFVYEYGREINTLSDFVEMLKGQVDRYEPFMPTVYTSQLRKFVDSYLGSEVELTKEQFTHVKTEVLLALEKAMEFVKGLDDCQNTSAYQFAKE